MEASQSDCYAWEAVVTCGAPLLPGVTHAVILSIDGSERLERVRRPDCFLYTLCANTIIQVNKGFARCRKPPHVTNSAFDLTDAYAHVAEKTQGWGNVLILEDDAVLMPGALATDFALVDAFVTCRPFSLYSLGSLGIVVPVLGTRHQRFVFTWGMAQAVIWSEGARHSLRKAVDLNPLSVEHVDIHFMATLRRSYTFNHPLVVQLLAPTANQGNWCFFCRASGIVAHLDRVLISVLLCIIKRLRIDQSTDGWNVVARVNLLTIPVLSILLLACCAAAAARLARSRRLRL
jgi:hypothetical protein